MDKNKKLIFSLVGCFFLVMLSSPLYDYAESILYFGRGYNSTFYGIIIHNIINFFSATGYILTLVFSVMLIISNINLKK